MEAKRTEHGGGVWLPEDVIFDVLARLPVKALCRFRCVCKGWHALISDPAFAAAQRSRAAPLVAGVFWAQHQRELRVMDTDGNVVRVVKGAVEGTPVPASLDLVCVDGGTELGDRVIDPATGRAVTVGGSVAKGHNGFFYHRFGRAVSGEYKVVRCSRYRCLTRHDRRPLEITTVGASGEPTWRRLPAQPAFTCSCHGCTAAVNGVLHFLTGHPFAPTCRSHVARLDLESEQWKPMIEAPATEWPKEEDRWETTIGELKGTLSTVETIRSHLDGTYANVWLLVDPKKSIWVKEYTIHMPRTVSLVEPLEVLGDGTILLLSTHETECTIGRKMFAHLFERKKMHILQLYDPSTRVCKNLMNMGEDQFVTLYTGSLLS